MVQQSKSRQLDWLYFCNTVTFMYSAPALPSLGRKNFDVQGVFSSQCQEASNSLSFYLILIPVTPHFLCFSL